MKAGRSIHAMLVLALVGTQAARAAEDVASPRPDAEATIDDYLERAFRRNRMVRAAAARRAAAEDMIPQARALEDPELSFEYMLEKHDMQYRVSLMQAIPAFGKRRLRATVAREQAAAAGYDVEAVRFMVFEDVIRAFHDYVYLRHATRVTGENIALLDDLEKVLLTRQRAGTSPYSEVLRVQVERDKLDDRLRSLADRREVVSARLGALLDLPAGAPLPWPSHTAADSATLPRDVLLDMLEDLNPELKAADRMVAGRSAGVDLAKRAYFPDLMLGAGYMLMPEDDEGEEPTDVALMVGLRLPIWWGRNAAGVREAQARREAETHRRIDLANELRTELIEALADLRDAQRKIRLYEDSLLPKATQALEVTRREFMNGEATFTALIDTQRTLLEFELILARAQSDREIALGAIGCCVGRYDLENLASGKEDNEPNTEKGER